MFCKYKIMNICLQLSFPIIIKKGCVISRRVSHSRRHLRRRLKDRSTSSELNLMDDLPTKSVKELVMGSSQAALEDLQSLIRVDNGRVMLSCKRSTINLVVGASFVIILSLTAIIMKIIKRGGGSNKPELLVYKRDRSLGGKEVLVAKKDTPSITRTHLPKWPTRSSRRSNTHLPKWWPQTTHQFEVENQHEYQTTANRLIRAILDNRMTGKDILEDDIIQLRRIGRLSGVKVSFDTENARDTLYRMAIDFVLNYCESTTNQSAFVLIDGEEAQNFVAGLADNVGLESTRAARMVSAAVAARTRSRFLQAWALEIQGKPSEAVVELFKICVIHQIFPPEESSPEMEMVARGLEKHLKVDQREFLLNALLCACGDKTRRSVAEALGLMYSKDERIHQQENKYT